MVNHSLEHQSNSNPDVQIYECEVHLKFRLIEEKGALPERSRLVEALLDAFAYGNDEFMEPIHVEAVAQEVSELLASPAMRRQLIRLRNARE